MGKEKNMTHSTHPANSPTCPDRSAVANSPNPETRKSHLRDNSSRSSLSSFPGPWSLFPALVIPITVNANSPILGVYRHHSNQHRRFFICMRKCLFHQIQCKNTRKQTLSRA